MSENEEKTTDPMLALIPDCIKDPVLCSSYELVGSRITCDPPVLNTDLDVLCRLTDNFYAAAIFHLTNAGFVFDGSEYYANSLDQSVGFRSYRCGEVNLVLTTDDEFYRRFSAASSVAKRLNLLHKPDRIALFQAVLYGNSASSDDPNPETVTYWKEMHRAANARGEWIAFADRWPNQSPALDDPSVQTTDTVLVTNNLHSRDRMGRMSHIWLLSPIQADGEVVGFNEANWKVHGLTHWQSFTPPTPGSEVRS